ncbi:hypothetical protein [Nitrososphaera viennensis]|uniref:Late embryogenesis abundant protein LEA-2 subgroup domain-containing protein n=2 Tax=Nitrososphaera viennensis TaxID=1034015 RepID=A0A060HQV1_9ARCH|nr:hypothetical protein [Nitrososphaera viennensis]AIC15547.1 hypothetical protein NVIE_013120 [Nitrososphaera viennensis EN76]UVS70432.1 hypothetical protein NWT39_06510 [Nitrososphaera viennensis]
MLIGPRRAVLIGAIAAVAATIILLPLIFGATAPRLNEVTVALSNVTVLEATAENMQMRVVFTVTNPTDQTATTSRIDYELFADGQSLGSHTLSYENVPLNGRPAIFSQNSVPLRDDEFVLEFDDRIADIYNKIRDNPDAITWRAAGTAQIESTLTLVPVTFDNEI